MRIFQSVTITCPFNKLNLSTVIWKMWVKICLYLSLLHFIVVIFFVILAGTSPLSFFGGLPLYLILGLKQWQHLLIHMMAWHWYEILSNKKFLLSIVLLFYYILSGLSFISGWILILWIFLLFYIVLYLPNYVLHYYQGLFLSLSDIL